MQRGKLCPMRAIAEWTTASNSEALHVLYSTSALSNALKHYEVLYSTTMYSTALRRTLQHYEALYSNQQVLYSTTRHSSMLPSAAPARRLARDRFLGRRDIDDAPVCLPAPSGNQPKREPAHAREPKQERGRSGSQPVVGISVRISA